jgi:hypothetical protein
MDFELIIIIVAGTLFFVGFIALFVKFFTTIGKVSDKLSGNPDVYKGPTGEPQWHGVLPDKVDDYVEPRYVYENLVETTEFLPENGRIIGYRISPTLVIHSTIESEITPGVFYDFVERLDGELLELCEIALLKDNWYKISELCIKSGQKILLEDTLWFDNFNDNPLVINFGNDYCYNVFDDRSYRATLVLKRT